jgi:lia operon protein LiaG
MKALRILMICLWSLVGLAILGVLIYSMAFGSMPGLGFVGFSGFGSDDTSTMQLAVDESFPVSGIDELEIDLASDDCNIYASDTNDIRIMHYVLNMPENRTVNVRQDGGTLKVDSGVGNIFSFGFAFRRESVVEIYVPTNWGGKLDAGIASGSVTLEDSFEFSELALKTSSGEIRSEHALKAKDADIDVTSGSIRLTGGLEAEEYRLKTTSGEIDVDERLAGSGRIDVTSGSVNVFGVEIAESLGVDVSSGDVDIELAGDPGLAFTARKTSGDIDTYFDIGGEDRHNYAATVGQAPYKKLDIEVTSGSIRVTRD